MIDARLRTPLLIGWALASAVLCVMMSGYVAGLRFTDPDDAMRLLQARDWLAGQSWWDVAQHRLNGGDFAMHWSRLVDLPLASVMAALDPLMGTAASTRIAMTAVPLLTLLAVMALAASTTLRLSGVEPARLAILLAPLSAPIIHQIRPMRIDHHGWQVALAAAAALLMVGPPTRSRGTLAGVALAALVTISFEGLPIAAAVVGVAALAWALRPERRAFLLALVWSFFVAAAALHIVTRGPALWQPACDAVAPAWIAALAVAAAGVTAATTLASRSRAGRLLSLAPAGLASAATLAWLAPDCLRGPFATLDPLVRDLWYLNTVEGLPIWRQEASWALTVVALPIVGLIGAGQQFIEADEEERKRWAVMILLAAASLALSLTVARAAATANALAMPGAACLLHRLLLRARAIRPIGKRIAATTAALLAASPGLAVNIGGGALRQVAPAPPSRPSPRTGCVSHADVRALAGLPASTIFAPIDVSPDLVATTRHRAIAAGYHRNADAMRRVITAFTGSPEEARRIVLASGADYLAICPGLYEGDIYADRARDGFWASLERGRRFEWLQPVPIRGSPVLAWRVIRCLPPGSARS